MEIKTKFNVGDKALAVVDGGFPEVVIKSIHINVYSIKDIELCYVVESKTELYSYRFKEDQLFKNKKDLIEFISKKL